MFRTLATRHLAPAAFRSRPSTMPASVATVAKRHASDKVKVAVVGAGRMGAIRAAAAHVNPKFQLCGIVDKNPAAAHTMASKYKTEVYPSVDEIVDDMQRSHGTRLDALILCSPTFLHSSLVRQAADLGLHVFTEKPVDESADKILELFRVAANGNIKLCCGFQRRFDASYASLAAQVQAGAVGHPMVANIFFADHPVPPKEFLLAGGDIFMDLSSHDVDFITHALQDRVASVYAKGGSADDELRDAGVHDHATMVMTFEKGTVATLFMSRYCTYGYDQRVEVFGTAGSARVGNMLENQAVISNASGMHRPRLVHSFPERFNAAFVTELDRFAEAILRDEAWPVTAQQCVEVQRVADAARESCRTGTIVHLNYGEQQQQQKGAEDQTEAAAVAGSARVRPDTEAGVPLPLPAAACVLTANDFAA